jgi:mannose-6-phosphate isomerase-like protein (cupin superfamily)
LWYTSVFTFNPMSDLARRLQFTFVPLITLMASQLLAQERKVDPTWLHRYVPQLADAKGEASSPSCHYKPIFGEGDEQAALMRSVARFTELAIDANATCPEPPSDREEAIYFVLQGAGSLQQGSESHPLRANDFTYLAPGMKHSIVNNTQQPLRLVVMGFKVPAGISVDNPKSHARIVNLDDVKEETVSGHPSSVLYKLMVGPRSGKRDAIDEAYVITSLFLMDFAPGGTNFPHHHETAEEIYLVLDGEGEMVAGSGMDGIEGRYPAKAGDAYYFRPNCTVGFYNQNKPAAKAHILAVRSKIPLPTESD